MYPHESEGIEKSLVTVVVVTGIVRLESCLVSKTINREYLYGPTSLRPECANTMR